MYGMEVEVSQGEGAVSGIFWHIRPVRLNGQNEALFAQNCIRLVFEKLTIL